MNQIVWSQIRSIGTLGFEINVVYPKL